MFESSSRSRAEKEFIESLKARRSKSSGTTKGKAEKVDTFAGPWVRLSATDAIERGGAGFLASFTHSATNHRAATIGLQRARLKEREGTDWD